MPMKARLKALDRFKAFSSSQAPNHSTRVIPVRVLVATDVASRGIDITGIGVAIHYHLPHSAELYVHRSGRAGRCKPGVDSVDKGRSIIIVTPQSFHDYSLLCKNLGRENLHSSLVIDTKELKVHVHVMHAECFNLF